MNDHTIRVLVGADGSKNGEFRSCQVLLTLWVVMCVNKMTLDSHFYDNTTFHFPLWFLNNIPKQGQFKRVVISVRIQFKYIQL